MTRAVLLAEIERVIAEVHPSLTVLPASTHNSLQGLYGYGEATGVEVREMYAAALRGHLRRMYGLPVLPPRPALPGAQEGQKAKG